MSCGALTVVMIVLTQLAGNVPAVPPFGHPGSPPPVASAVLLSDCPDNDACGVTGIANVTGVFVANGAGCVQVTCCNVLVHPAGNVPIVKPAGIWSMTLVTSVVAALPIFVSCNE